MTQQYDIVPLDGEPDPAAGAEDILDVRPTPRWVRVAAAMVAAGVLVALVLTHRERTTSGAVAPAPTASAGPVAPPPPSDPNGQPDDTVASAAGSWVLDGGALLAVRGTRVLHRVPVPGLPTGAPGRARLVLDAGAQRIWVVVEDGSPTWMAEFDLPRLRLLRTAVSPTPAGGAAALAGHLFLSTARGVVDVAPPAARPRFVAGLSGAVGAIAVDPARRRLVLLDLGFPTSAWTYRPGSPPVEAAGSLPFEDATLAVAGGAIWVTGRTASGTVLERLDPTTLQRVATSPLSGRLGADAALIAAGRSSLWIRDTGPAELTCADAATGRVEQVWHVLDPAAVSSPGRGALVATSDGFADLPLGRCRG